MVKKLVSIAIPVFNEAENILPLYERVRSATSQLSDRFNFEFIFTDNHSTDASFEILKELASKDHRIRVIRFSKNFGYQRSIYTAHTFSLGNAAIQLDCDLQDPPEVILDFLKKWEEGYHVVYGIRRSRKEGFFITMMRKLFYRLIDMLSEDKLPYDAGDFRLVDRVVLYEQKNIYYVSPYLRGTIASMGFNQIGIPYDRDERKRGRTKFKPFDLINLATDGILNHSVVPLRIATFVGLTTSLLTVFGMLCYAIARIFVKVPWPSGFTTIVILVLLSIALNGVFLGIIGEYLGRIYQQVKIRPITIVEKTINITEQKGLL